MAKVSYKGKYKPENPQKYVGNPDNIWFRSLWELKLFNYLDKNTAILQWSSEELAIPYVSPLDGKIHRYFPDVVFKGRTKSNEIKTYMIEVKPEKQKSLPLNEAKFAAANKYCEHLGWEFKIITEKELKIKV